MRIYHIIWLPDIEDKLFHKHNVLVEEVEEALFEQPHIRFVEKGHREGEDLYAAYGQTTAGRWLIAFFVLKSPHEALVISARDMTRKERRLYARR
ncbi:MAG: BrnT family toxin [Chloroflexi bacterium]|nr:BrnT family toxin [Chloroflexota bacterium]